MFAAMENTKIKHFVSSGIIRNVRSIFYMEKSCVRAGWAGEKA